MSKEYEYYSVILNSNHIVKGTKNSVFKYDFRQGIKFKNASMFMSSLNMFYSWFNITSALNNNKFSYKWFDTNGELNDVHTVTIDDGNYNINDLNEYLQSILVSRGHYIKQVSSGNHIYHLELTSNPNYYAIQLNCYAMRTESGDYVRGSTEWAWPTVATTVQIIFSTSNLFNDLLGFLPWTYPAVSDTNNHTFLSEVTPDMNPVSSLMMTSSICTQGGFSDPDNIIFSFTSGTTGFGSMIEKAPVIKNFIKIRDGQYTNFTIEFLDQYYRRVDILDPSTVITVIFKVPKEKVLFER
jgi:hypothetical protein